ncbi:MAG: domain containing protein [Bacteroidetes bacterium]|jgi:uncharacterized RDD family membrane protein YckC|nr:domain containing protein [Bacteroidota bacterium]
MFDDGIHINTTQNVLISYQPAGVGERILASLLDTLFMVAYFVAACIGFGVSNAFDNMTSFGFFAFIMAITLPMLLYHLLMEQFFNGQSLGKKIMKIKVVKLDGTQPGFGAYLVRWVMRIIDTVLFNGVIALLTVALSERSQRLGDMAAGTTVVSMKQKVSLKNTILYKTASDYKIVFQEVSKLSDKDMGIIKDVFDHCVRNGDSAGLMQLSKKVKAKMEVITTLRDEQFIKVVLMDYSQYQFEK